MCHRWICPVLMHHDRHKAGTDAYGVRRYDRSGVRMVAPRMVATRSAGDLDAPRACGHLRAPRRRRLRRRGVSSITIPPAKGRPQLPPRNAVVQATQDGRLAVTLAAQPAKGGDKMIATIVGPDNVGKDGLDVSFGRGNASRAGTPCGSGCYSAVLPKTGPRAVDVDVAGRTVEFQLPARWPAPDATALSAGQPGRTVT